MMQDSMQLVYPPSTADARQGAIPPGGLGAGDLSHTHKSSWTLYTLCCLLVSGADLTGTCS